ncbi:MAG: sulfite exporter TauE/SafE family protein [Pseudomonadota bacterium]
MLAWALIVGVSFGASLLTFFAGFGLGTLLLPVFALFFPAETALLATAIVHLTNNLFKLGLIHRHIAFDVLWRFGLPAMAAATLGAWLLLRLAGLAPLATWELAGATFEVRPAGLVIGFLIVAFAVRELFDLKRETGWPRRWLSVGGLISGFFGGLSGHQGALRSAFLVGAGLSREGFIATGVAIAVLVDITRLGQYFAGLDQLAAEVPRGEVVAATLAAFAGAYIGRRLLTKIRVQTLYRFVGTLLIVAGIAMAAGLI